MERANENGTNVHQSNGLGYCLRWNNHKSNFSDIMESIVRKDIYTDCTLYVDGRNKFQVHRVVLAACSKFFQTIFKDTPQDHCTLILPDVKELDMKNLIDYIYTGEVNIQQSDIVGIIEVAKILGVKGLVNCKGNTCLNPPVENTISPVVDLCPLPSNPSTGSFDKREQPAYIHPLYHSSPIISTSTRVSPTQNSSSPTHSNKQPYIDQLYAQANREERSRQWPPISLPLSRSAQSMLSSVYETGSDMNPLKRKKLSSISSMLMTRDTPILRNVLAQTSNAPDTLQNPTLSTNQSPTRGNGGNSNGFSETNDSNNNYNSNNNASSSGNANAGNHNGSVGCSGYQRKSSDRSYHSSNGSDNSEKKFKDEEPSSPFTDRSFEDEPTSGNRRTSPPEFMVDMGLPAFLQQHQLQQGPSYHQQQGQGVQGGSGQNQKPEWKRYKQYTRQDIGDAIICVRNGMSALQASRKFGVPSRTLYDKVKKLGITTGTPRNRSSMKRECREVAGPSTASFPYGIGGAPGAFGFHPNQDNQLSQSHDFVPDLEEINNRQRANHSASLLENVFLQNALEARGEDFRGDALHAMALAAAAHAQLNGRGQTSPRRPSLLANLMEQNIETEMNRERERIRLNGEHTAIKIEPAEESEEEIDLSERAENLSISRRPSSPAVAVTPIHSQSFVQTLIEQPRGVIVPPMNYTSPSAEPSSTTPPALEQRPVIDKNNCEDSPIALIPTTSSCDE